MKPKTKQLISKVESAHDWDLGQPFSKGGTTLYSTDTCRICGLTWKSFSDPQNGVEKRYTFNRMDGQEISLAEAAELKCC